MIEYKAQRDGRYLFSDDLINLRDIALSNTQILGKNNYVISGCQFKEGKLTAGYVFLEGKIREVAETTFDVSPATIYIAVKNTSLVEYSADETTDKTEVAVNYGTEVLTSMPTSACISHTADKDFPRFEDSWLAKLRLADQFMVGNKDSYVKVTPGQLEIAPSTNSYLKVFLEGSKLNTVLTGLLTGEDMKFEHGDINALTAESISTKGDRAITIRKDSINLKDDCIMSFLADKVGLCKSLQLAEGLSVRINQTEIDEIGISLEKGKYLLDWGSDYLRVNKNTRFKNSIIEIEADNTNSSQINDVIQITNTSILHHNQATHELKSGFIFKDDDIYIRLNGVDSKIQTVGGMMLTSDNQYVSSSNGLTFKKVFFDNPTISGGSLKDIEVMSTKCPITVATGPLSRYNLQLSGNAILMRNKDGVYNTGIVFDTDDTLGFKLAGVDHKIACINGFMVDSENPYILTKTEGDATKAILKDFIIQDAERISTKKLIFNAGDDDKAVTMTSSTARKEVNIDGNVKAAKNNEWTVGSLIATGNAGFASRNTVLISGSLKGGTLKITAFYNGKTETHTAECTYNEARKLPVYTIDVSKTMFFNEFEANFPIDVVLVDVDSMIGLNINADLGKQFIVVNCQDESGTSTVFVNSVYGDDDLWPIKGGQVRAFLGIEDRFNTTKTNNRKPDAAHKRSGLVCYSHMDNGMSQN